MKKTSFLALGIALLAASCAPRFTSLPAEPGPQPNPDALLKAMSTRLATTKQYRFTATRTVPAELAKALNHDPKADIDTLVARPDRLAFKVSERNSHRKMFFDGRTFTVVDGANNFYSKTPLRGSLDQAAAHLAEVYGFQPPLTEFIVSDPYRGIKHRVTGISYLGKGTVRESGGTVQCHRIGMHGKYANGELWLGVADSLPRRLKATQTDTGAPLVDFDFLTWDLNPQVDPSAFRHTPAAGITEIPMVTLEAANKNSL